MCPGLSGELVVRDPDAEENDVKRLDKNSLVSNFKGKQREAVFWPRGFGFGFGSAPPFASGQNNLLVQV